MRPAPLLAASLVLVSTSALAGAARPDLGSVSPSDRRLIERACEVERGTESYDACVGGELEALKHVKIPDLAALPPSQRQLLEKACALEQQLEGPATYYACANRFLAVLHESFGNLDAAEKAVRSHGAPPRPHPANAGSAIPPQRAARLAGQGPRPAHSPQPATPHQDLSEFPAGDVLLVVCGVACVAAVFLMRFNRETCDECGSTGKLNELGLCAACRSKENGAAVSDAPRGGAHQGRTRTRLRRKRP